MEGQESVDFLGESDRTQSRGRKRAWLWFALGLALGVAGTLFVPDLARQYAPGLSPQREQITGLVVGKKQEEDRLLFTVQSTRGAVLATFRKRIPEINLLVSRGDSVTLGAPRFQPFLEEPELREVKKFPAGQRGVEADTARPAGPAPRDTAG